MNSVTILDYGLGNLLSVQRAFEHFKINVSITDSPAKIENADRLIIPGVGAFPRGMEELQKRNLVDSIKTFKETERPLFAICLGMQLLMEFGEEHSKTKGLNLIPGKVVKFPSKFDEFSKIKTPHIGWSELSFESTHSKYNNFRQFNNKQMYFVHSYYVDPNNKSDSLATTKHDNFEFCSVISSGSIFGCQFHPEKSGGTGLRLIQNFMNF
jgi:glutamine amidotransferase